MIINIFLILIFTFLSGIGDSLGFLHGSRIWKNDVVNWNELIKSGLGYGLGIATYWLAIKYLVRTGVVSPELQTIGWFIVAIIGVAILSGDFFHWQLIDKTIAVAIIIGLIWLMYRISL